MKSLLPAAVLGTGLWLGMPSAKADDGSLIFADGTTDFASQVDFVAGNSFQVLFNPASLTFVDSSTGPFVPPFAGGTETVGVSSPLSVFNFVSVSADPLKAVYQLQSDGDFFFANGAQISILKDTFFDVTFSDATRQSVQVVITPLQPPDKIAKVLGIGEAVAVVGGAFTFNDTVSPNRGSYSAQVDVITRPNITETPAPLPIFGAGIAFGFSRRIRKRINSRFTA